MLYEVITIPTGRRTDYMLFSETLGRFVVTIAPDNKRAFERAMGSDATLIGRVSGKNLQISEKTMLLSVPVSELEDAYNRITSYNVCYTKLLRFPEFVSQHLKQIIV